MQTAVARAASAYQQTQVQSRSPLELVVLLYDGAVRYMTEARDAMAKRDLVAKRDALSRSMAIIGELHATLNMKDGGQIAVSLDALYSYVNARLLDANMKGDVAAIDESIKLIGQLREAWAHIAANGTDVK
jgi:flagellar protein FliS